MNGEHMSVIAVRSMVVEGRLRVTSTAVAPV
jgi:hypothetical protein